MIYIMIKLCKHDSFLMSIWWDYYVHMLTSGQVFIWYYDRHINNYKVCSQNIPVKQAHVTPAIF